MSGISPDNIQAVRAGNLPVADALNDNDFFIISQGGILKRVLDSAMKLFFKGDKGDQGNIGPAGAKGDKGDQGNIGPAGAKGDKGDTGFSGAVGPVGPAGANGAVGAVGAKGDKGDQGNPGLDGPGYPRDMRMRLGTNEPSLDNWQVGDAAVYGNFPMVKLLLIDATGNAGEVQGSSPIYVLDNTDPDNPKVTRISWDLGQVSNCIILIN